MASLEGNLQRTRKSKQKNSSVQVKVVETKNKLAMYFMAHQCHRHKYRVNWKKIYQKISLDSHCKQPCI